MSYVVAILLLSTSLLASSLSQGVQHFKSGAFKEAYPYLEEALQEEPNSPIANYYVGLMHFYAYLGEKSLLKAKKFFKTSYNFGNIRAGCYLAKINISSHEDVNLSKEIIKHGISLGIEDCKQFSKLAD